MFEHLHARFGTSWFKTPARVKPYPIDPLTGRLAAPDRPGILSEKCLTAPEPIRAADYDGSGRLRLAPEYGPWLESPQNTLGNLAIVAEAGAVLRITQPKPGTVYYLDGDLPLDSQCIPLRAEADSAVRWECASLQLRMSDTGQQAQFSEGRHRIVARAPATGQEASTWIEVKHW